MKKELAAGALLLLLAAAAIWNVRYLDRACGALTQRVAEAQAQYAAGAPGQAAEALRGAMDDWDAMDRYAHVLLQHDAVQSVTETFYAALDALNAGDPAAAAQMDLLRLRIENISESEHAALGNVLCAVRLPGY